MSSESALALQSEACWCDLAAAALQMETETSLPNPQSNANALATAPATAPAAAAAPSQEQTSTSQAAAAQPAASDRLAAAPQTDAAAPTQQAGPSTVEAQQAPAASDAAQQQQQQQAGTAAGPAGTTANAVEGGSAVRFTSGTVLRFDMDADDVPDSSTLDYRAIWPIFGGRKGGVKHCDYHRVSVHLYPPPPPPTPPPASLGSCLRHRCSWKSVVTAECPCAFLVIFLCSANECTLARTHQNLCLLACRLCNVSLACQTLFRHSKPLLCTLKLLYCLHAGLNIWLYSL